MLRRIVFTLHTGYCGMDAHDFQVWPSNTTEEELNEEAWELAISNAESYGIYPYPDDCDESSSSEDEDSYSYNIEGYWEDYDPKKHDGLSTGTPIYKLFERLEKEYNE